MTGRRRERVNQKRRTRAAIVAAVVELAEDGKTPSVSEAADAAGVGRTTAYRYFPTQDHLLFEAILDSVPADIGNALDSANASTDPEERALSVVNTHNSRVREHEQAFRTILRLSLEKAAFHPDGKPSEVRLLGGHRARWFDEALSPARERLSLEDYRRLIGGLSLCIGAEPFVVLRDTCGMDSDEILATTTWIAETLIRSALAEAAPSRSRRSGSKGRGAADAAKGS